MMTAVQSPARMVAPASFRILATTASVRMVMMEETVSKSVPCLQKEHNIM